LKKVLIIGGGGFIGRGITDYLISKRNYNITVADISFPENYDSLFDLSNLDKTIKIIKSDFTDPKSFLKLDSEYDYVYMLASIVGVNKCIQEPDKVILINTALIQNSLEWITNNNIGRMLFSSSSECYVASTDFFNYPVPTNEDVPLSISDISHPRFTYAVTKMLGESAFLTFGKKLSIPTTIVRYQNIFGPQMGFNHVIPHLVERFYKGNENPFKIYGADQTRAFCYITDAAEGTVLAMESKKSDQEVFHIGSDKEITIEELVEATSEIIGYEGKFIHDSPYPGSVSRRCPDISKSRTLLNYVPKVSWEDGLKITIDWYISFFESNSPIDSGGFKAPRDLDI